MSVTLNLKDLKLLQMISLVVFLLWKRYGGSTENLEI